MIPFLKRKQDGSASMPVDTIHREHDEDSDGSDFDGLETAMEELHNALMAKNYKGAAQIFRDAQELIDSEPHEEGEHTND